MPRYNSDKPFQIGEFWLSRRPKSEAWCRTWFDSEARQTRRISLGTSDFNEAEQSLIDWLVLFYTKTEEQSEDATLAELLARYYEQYGSRLLQMNSGYRCVPHRGCVTVALQLNLRADVGGDKNIENQVDKWWFGGDLIFRFYQ